MASPTTRFSAPRVFIGPQLQENFVIVYKFYRVTLYFFVQPSSLAKIAFYKSLHSFINPRLGVLMKMVAEHQKEIHAYDLIRNIDFV